ncbi:MAG: DsbE family thiol:disulfide interchange protein, partial [Gammaproteobacteria bacterium]|nr:DsbE family thiol:disulfide interchange protein [Gammaproteobacteria bacterium]
MTRFLLPAGVFALLVTVLFIGVQRAPEKTVIPSALIGKPAPAFVLPVLGRAEQFSAASMRGRWYVLECRNEHETLLEIARSRALPVIGLNWKDDDAAAREWLEQLGNPYDVVAVDREGRVAIDWGVYGAPETFLVDASGT